MTQEYRQTAAWAFLVGATLLSFWAAAHLGARTAIGVSMAIAAAKIIVVLRRFMAAERTAPPLQLYFLAWSIGCATMIFTVACIS